MIFKIVLLDRLRRINVTKTNGTPKEVNEPVVEMPSITKLFLARVFQKIEKDHGDVETVPTQEGDLINIGQLESNYDKLSPAMQEDMGLFLNQFQENVQK